MAELQNEFSWSKSRHEKLAECPRAYFYAYYGSWGGWEAAHGTPVRELYVLKKLSSRWQWAGSVVHGALKNMLNAARATGTFWPIEKLLDRTRQKARAEWASSREKAYWREASRIVGLVEHEYGEPVAGEDWKRLFESVVEGGLRAFHASETLEAIRAAPRERWLTVDELDSWTFEGTKIWVAVDFAYRDADGRVHVLDWKTGKERGVDHMQVAIYSLYAQRKWQVPADGVAGGLVYLVGQRGAAERVTVAADPAALSACQAEMRTSISTMKAALADPTRNVAEAAVDPKLPLRWALDFNVDPMCSVIAQVQDGQVRVLNEICIRRATTDQACEEFLQRYPHYDAGVVVYGDASGSRRQTTGCRDFEMVRQAFTRHRSEGVSFRVPSGNPDVRERVGLVNAMLKSADGQTKLVIDPQCIELIRDMEQFFDTHGSGKEALKAFRNPADQKPPR